MCISPSILFFPRKLIIRTVFCFSFHSQTSQPRRSAIKSALRKPLGDKMGAFRASAEIERLAASAKKENANITLCSPLSVSSFLTVYSRLFCFLSFSSFFFLLLLLSSLSFFLSIGCFVRTKSTETVTIQKVPPERRFCFFTLFVVRPRVYDFVRARPCCRSQHDLACRVCGFPTPARFRRSPGEIGFPACPGEKLDPTKWRSRTRHRV